MTIVATAATVALWASKSLTIHLNTLQIATVATTGHIMYLLYFLSWPVGVRVLLFVAVISSPYRHGQSEL
jgi:hypothetical protein